MRRFPSFHGLRAFEAAARLGSFLLASEELHLTASAISHQIRALEGYFGRSLFIRHNRQVELTADGQRLFARLSAAFDLIEATCLEIGPNVSTQQQLSLHSAPSFASKWLGPRLPSFIRQHPAVNLHVSATADPADFAKQHDVDLSITYGKPLAQRGVLCEALGTEVIAALAAPAVAARYDLTSPDASHGLVLIDSAVSPVRWSDWFALNQLPFPQDASRPSFDRAALAVAAAAQGLGMVLESTRFAQPELKSGELVRVGRGRFQDISRQLHFLCYREAQQELPKIAAFRKWLVDAVAADTLVEG